MKDAAGTSREGAKRGVGGWRRWRGEGALVGSGPTERRDKALTPLPGCILQERQLWIGNITAAGN